MARTLEPDDQIAHYRVVGPLGAGGMGEVYIARDETLERSVALKILPPALVRSEERLRRFVTEAKSASSLNHPNIVTIYEIGVDPVRRARTGGVADPAADPIHYISMELVAGESLEAKIHHERADLRSLVDWLAQAAEGVAKAHASGIVHRDLKPGNIMVSRDGFAKVLDFGLAKLTERSVPEADRTSAPTAAAPVTGVGSVMGTVGYMSPEQVQAKAVDHRSDIFSLGCILYEAAARRRPFTADSDIETLHRILKDKPTPVEEIDPTVPVDLRRVIRRCLAKQPDQRFQSMKDIAIDLREMAESWDSLSTSTPPATSVPPGAHTGPGSPATSAPGGAAIGGAASGSVAAGAGVATGSIAAGGSMDGGAATSGMAIGASVGGGAAAGGSMGGGVATSGTTIGGSAAGVSGAQPALAATGGRGRAIGMAAAILIGLGGLGFGAWSWMQGGAARGDAARSVNLQDLSLSILMSRPDLSQDETGAMALSADGRYLAYVTVRGSGSSLQVRQVRTGSEVTVVADSRTPVQHVAFSRDGDFLYFLNRDDVSPNYNALYQVASLGGTPRKVLFDVDSAPAFSPDGRQVCFQRGLLREAADSVVVADLSTGATRELLRVENPERFNTSPDWSPDGSTILIALETPIGGFRTRLLAIDPVTGKSTPIPGRDWVRVSSARFMPDGKAILATALDIATGSGQIFRVAYPGGEALRLTNDFDGYGDLSVAADGASVAAVRDVANDNLWVADGRNGWKTEPITFGAGSAASIKQIAGLPDGAVAFTAPEGGTVRLFGMQADGSGRRRLNNDGVFVMNTIYAPGLGLLFTQVDAIDVITSHIWRVDPDGNGLKRLTDGAGEQLLGASADGGVLLFTRWEKRHSLFSLRAGETEPRQISDRSVGNSPSTSPDGSKVMYVTVEPVGDRFSQQVHIAPAEGGPDLATFMLPPGGVFPFWSRGADDEVLYLDTTNRFNMMRLKFAGGEPQPITRLTEGVLTGLRWSHATQYIAYGQSVGTSERLFVMHAGTWKPTLVQEFKTGRVNQMSWAPDAPILYFTYGAANRDVVLVSGIK